MGYFRELPNIAYQSPLTHKNSSRDYILIKNIFRRTKLYDFLKENVSLLDKFTIGDGDRVYPGDGVAPLTKILKTLMSNGFRGALSLELFNRSYWEKPAVEVIQTGLAKMKESVAIAQD